MNTMRQRPRYAWVHQSPGRPARLVAWAGVCALALAALFWWSTPPAWPLAFAESDPADSPAAVNAQQAQSVPFPLRDGATNFEASVERVDRAGRDVAEKRPPAADGESRDGVDSGAGAIGLPEQELRFGVENDVNAKVTRVLEPLLGAGGFVVRTTADMTFEKIVRREKLVDPDVSALVSERRTKERAFAPSAPGAPRRDEVRSPSGAPSRETNTVNQSFDYSVIERTVEAPSGQLRRLSVAVLIDAAAGRASAAAGSLPAWRSPEGLKKIEHLVKTAISFDAARGDVVTIEVAPFQPPPPPPSHGIKWCALAPYAMYALLFAALAAAILGLGRSLLRTKPEAMAAPVDSPAPSSTEAELAVSDAPASAAAETGRARLARLAQLALEQPRSVGQTLRLWLHARAETSSGGPGAPKAALLLTLIGEEAAAAVLRQLDADEVAAITGQIARADIVDPDQHAGVLEEFEELARGARGLKRAGVPLVRRLLARVHPGEDVERLVQESEPPPPAPDEAPAPRLLEGLAAAAPRQLALVLDDEPEQTVALVLAHLPADLAAQVLALLPPARRVEVARRMAALEEVRPDVVERVGTVLERRLASMPGGRAVHVDGVRAATAALAGLGRSAGHDIVEALTEAEPDLSRRLRERLFTFGMLRGLSECEVQELTRVADRGVLALALRGADPERRELLLRSMPRRAAALLREEMDLQGAPRIADIEKAQRQVVEVLLRLEREGAISLAGQEESQTV